MEKKEKIALTAVVCMLILAGGSCGAFMVYINYSVEKYCAVAMKAHPDSGANILALIEYVNSQSHSLKERNFAVWTLGRMGDPRALETLEAVYTGGECDHDHALCQHELSKAIKLCKSRNK